MIKTGGFGRLFCVFLGRQRTHALPDKKSLLPSASARLTSGGPLPYNTHDMKIQRLKLKRLNNTRDLGGMPAEGGRAIKAGKLFRSGRLSRLPGRTKAALEGFGIRTVVDLRTDTERCEHPDTLLEGAEYVALPLLCAPTGGITAERSSRLFIKAESRRIKEQFGTADNYMIHTYRGIAFDKKPQESLRRFLRLAVERESLLWHCTGGKDRAGICAMLLEALLGVKEEDIYTDYLASRRFCRRKFVLNRLAVYIAPLTLKFKKVLLGLMRIKREYLEGVISEMKERYGSIVGYCRQELGITDADIAILREKFLV